MDGRTDQTATATARALAGVDGVISGYLFGSVAQRREHRDSDLDLAVLLDWTAHPDRRERFEARLRLIAEIGAAVRRNDIDLLILNDAPPHLAREIVTRGRRVYLADGEADHAFRRTVMLRAADLEPFLRRARRVKLQTLRRMTFLVERLVELRRHLDHLRRLAPRVTGRMDLERDLSLHNDVLFSLLMVAQLVIDIAGELAARRGDRFEDYTEAVRSLSRDARFAPDLVRELERLPVFRNIVVHEYVALDLDRAVEALHRLDPVRQFVAMVAQIEAGSE